jgi:hypothetical protein
LGTPTQVCLFGTYGSPNSWSSTFISINSSELTVFSGISENIYTIRVAPAALLRDYSSWYHIVVSVDTTQTTASNRVNVYINGVQQTSFTHNIQPTQNLDTKVNGTVLHTQGAWLYGSTASYGDCYLTEVNFIDGQALDPLAFGRINSKTGVWTPAKYTGTYGTNGFYLKFTDTSSNTATGIGKDFSGNGNNWTPNNISLTAGATYDSMIDTPTPYNDGGYGRGNYATLNPLENGSATFDRGNLRTTTSTTSGKRSVGSTVLVSSGSWYCEVECVTNGSSSAAIGIANASFVVGSEFRTYCYGYYNDGKKIINNSYSSYGASYNNGDIIGIAFNADSGTLTFYKNGSSQGTISSIPSDAYRIAVAGNSSLNTSTFEVNFGQRPFAYTPPTGFKTLCTQNLPTPAIVNPAQFMAATTYAGTGATQTIANTVNSRSFQPDLVWIKGRSAATDHALYDSVRGTTKDLVSNSTAAETTQATGLTTFGSNGFTVGNLGKLNTSAQTYVAWQWKAGDSTVTNTAGTITSQVDANPAAGFSIVSYVGPGTACTVGHGLGVAPKMIIIKDLTDPNEWMVYHSSLGADKYLMLHSTNASATSTIPWNNTVPSSSVFSIGAWNWLNYVGGANRYIAYCFAEVEGFSKFGSYTGNGSADGPFIYCGFRPKWVMIKRTDAVNDWIIYDTVRQSFNTGATADASNYIRANLAIAEDIDPVIDCMSNGFKIDGFGAFHNASGGSYIFAAFAEAPFKYALAR